MAQAAGIFVESCSLVGGLASRNAVDHVSARMARLRLDPALHRDALQEPMRRGFRNFSSAICRPHCRRDTRLSATFHHDVPADGIFDSGHRATRWQRTKGERQSMRTMILALLIA